MKWLVIALCIASFVSFAMWTTGTMSGTSGFRSKNDFTERQTVTWGYAALAFMVAAILIVAIWL